MEEKTENDVKKEFLMSYQIAKRDVERLEVQLAELRLNKLSPSCMIGDGMPHAHNPVDLSEYVAQVDEIEREIVNARYKRILAFKRIQRSIEMMKDEREKDLLTFRYIKYLKWEEICTKMKYSWRKIHYLHSDALQHFEICA